MKSKSDLDRFALNYTKGDEEEMDFPKPPVTFDQSKRPIEFRVSDAQEKETKKERDAKNRMEEAKDAKREKKAREVFRLMFNNDISVLDLQKYSRQKLDGKTYDEVKEELYSNWNDEPIDKVVEDLRGIYSEKNVEKDFIEKAVNEFRYDLMKEICASSESEHIGLDKNAVKELLKKHNGEAYDEPIDKMVEEFRNALTDVRDDLMLEVYEKAQKTPISVSAAASEVRSKFKEIENILDANIMEEAKDLSMQRTGVVSFDVPEEEHNRVMDVLCEIGDLHEKKNKDYGGSFESLMEEFGLHSTSIRLTDKLSRFKQLIDNDAEVKDESIRDTLIDAALYSIKTVAWMDKYEEKASNSEASVYIDGKRIDWLNLIDQLAHEVINGEHGEGEVRKRSLGSRYDEVQKRVNEILPKSYSNNK